jgi:predicted amino acid-binding ACT domain protein
VAARGGFAVTAIGRDRPGIVAAISGVFADIGANIEDACMAILRGNFAVMLIAALPEGADQAELEARLGGGAGTARPRRGRSQPGRGVRAAPRDRPTP